MCTLDQDWHQISWESWIYPWLGYGRPWLHHGWYIMSVWQCCIAGTLMADCVEIWHSLWYYTSRYDANIWHQISSDLLLYHICSHRLKQFCQNIQTCLMLPVTTDTRKNQLCENLLTCWNGFYRSDTKSHAIFK